VQEFLQSVGRNAIVVNLDPANDRLTYDCKLNIYDLITVEDVMANCGLGPNGGLMYCMEYLEENVEWLIQGIDKLIQIAENKRPPYFIFDLPGQCELYTHHNSIKNIIEKLSKLDFRLCCVNLIDSYHITDPSKFISALLMSLSSMLQLELPHVNILSKMDLIKQYGEMKFNLNFYTDVLNLNYLVDTLESDKLLSKFKKLNKKICDIVQDYSLVSFTTLNIQKKSSILKCIQQIDKANGYIFGHLDDTELLNSIAGQVDTNDFIIQDDELLDELEQQDTYDENKDEIDEND
jgi:GPN-loop GTPase